MLVPYPGTPQHQVLLDRVVSYYRDDRRVRAVCLFGSLVRGNWDEYSDLDLDVTVEDDAQIRIIPELQNLCAAFQPLGEHPLIVVASSSDAGDIVLLSLAELSIRYHTLATTSPNIVDSLQLLAGSLTIDVIKAAGMANQEASHSVSDADIDHVLRWAVEVNIRLRRRHIWQAVQLLQHMRDTLIDIFAFSRGYPRAYQTFEAEASEMIKTRLGETFPRHNLDSIQAALMSMLAILENDLDVLSNGHLRLTETQRAVITKVRERMKGQLRS